MAILQTLNHEEGNVAIFANIEAALERKLDFLRVCTYYWEQNDDVAQLLSLLEPFKKHWKKASRSQLLKMLNLNFGIFHQFLSFENWPVW